MGHLAAKSIYQDLQQRLDRMPIGAPEHQAFLKILKIVFSEEEAFIASRMPIRFATLDQIQKRTGKNHSGLAGKLDNMAEKGLVIDLQRGPGKTRYILLPTVIGFFEFSMMRARDDYDQQLLSQLYEEYMLEDPLNTFLQQALSGETQIVRTLVHESALEPEVYAEVLDFEKATWIVKQAKRRAVSLCHCRHVKMHIGAACEHPLRTCMTLGNGTEYLIRRGLAEPIDQAEALDILTQSKEMGLVQLADNVKNNVGFICNCCQCSCTILESFRRLDMGEKRMYTSNYLAVITGETCSGCGKCVKACPVNSISLQTQTTDSKKKKPALVDDSRCIGCGVCIAACPTKAIQMENRPRRVVTPQNSIERILMMALERNKLQHVLFDNIESIPISSISKIVGWFLKRKSLKQLLLKENIRSKWLNLIAGAAKR